MSKVKIVYIAWTTIFKGISFKVHLDFLHWFCIFYTFRLLKHKVQVQLFEECQFSVKLCKFKSCQRQYSSFKIFGSYGFAKIQDVDSKSNKALYPSSIALITPLIFYIPTFSPSQIEILQTVKDADGEAIQNNARHLKDHDHPPSAN